MTKRKTEEHNWHTKILMHDEASFEQLVEAYQQPILNHILNGFGSYLRHDFTLANEAVWKAFQYYRQFPQCYQPSKGSLYSYLQIHAERGIQLLLQKENRNWHFQHLDYILSRFFDNEQDIRLAKLILKNEVRPLEFAIILDIGALPISMQLKEIARNTRRITGKLLSVPIDFSAMANRRKNMRKKILSPAT